MKIIYPDKINTVASSEENANYPDDNILDTHPKKVWKATSKDAALTLTIDGGTNTLAIYNTNANSVVITIKNTAETETYETETIDLTGIDTIYELITDSGEAWTSLWYDYTTYRDSEHKAILDFTSSDGVIVEAGVIRAGYAYNFSDIQYGINEGLVDYSIVKELNNGAFYTRKRDIVRTFNGNLILERDPDFYVLLRTIVTENGPEPLAIKLSELNQYWHVFGRFSSMPSGNHGYLNKSVVGFNIIEVL